MIAAPIDACDPCTRRSWLVARLAGHLELRRAEREAIREVLALSDEQLIDALGGVLAPAIREEHAAMSASAIRDTWHAAGGWSACRHSPRYPRPLADLNDAPSVLHGQGDAGRLDELVAAPGVAIVGARKASPDGREVARLLGRGLSAAGVTVVSGMALGIDSAAHEGAMDAGANTVAVLACGPDVPYPRSRRDLYCRLRARATVISEAPPGSAPYRWAFPARNRLIAALAQTTIVVEAAERSGSLITADLAIGLGREVAAVPGSPLNWRCAGSNDLLRDGATVVRDAVDVLDGLAGAGAPGRGAGRATADGEHARRPALPPAGLPEHLQLLLLAVEAGEDTVDDHARTPQEARSVLADLTELELLGLVVRGQGGRYARARR